MSALDFRAAVLSEGRFAPADLDTALAAKTLAWLDIVATDPALARELLEVRLGFPELEVEDALSGDERPTVQESDDHLFLVAPAVTASGNFVEVAFFIRGNLLITVTTEECAELQKRFQTLTSRTNQKGKTPGYLLYEVLDGLVDDYFPWMDSLEDRVDELEDGIYAGRADFTQEALLAKRSLLETRRRLSPLRDVINRLLRHDVKAISKDLWPYYQDIFDHVMRLGESVDLIRDVLTTLLDANLAIVSNRLNDIMRKMTVIATILMSMALISGIYGMNFIHMPELKWLYGYPFSLVIMLAVALIELVLFRWKKWL